ncbi:unnamed protein product, partial [Hapterophycus canaliculatus]
QAYISGKRYDEAETDATSVLELESGNLKALKRRAIARRGLKIPDVDGARADLIRLLTLEPGIVQVSFLREMYST